VKRWQKLGLAALAMALIVGLIIEAVQGMQVKREDFTATDLSGKQWSLAEHRGKGPILLNFFSTTCSPCAQEFPELVKLQQEYRSQGLQVVLIAREDAASLRTIPALAEAPMTLLTDSGHVFDRYGINAIPHTIFFDRSGQVATEIQGYDSSALAALEKQL
jgi:peroxiredoxin